MPSSGCATNDNTCQTKFSAFPTTVKFFFGWDDHTSAIKCVNPEGEGEGQISAVPSTPPLRSSSILQFSKARRA